MFTPNDSDNQLPLDAAFSHSPADPSVWGINTGANSVNHPSQLPNHLVPPPTPDFQALGDAIKSTQSPYMTMGAHGWLQDNHPGVAGDLDNALLAVANTPQGRTTGENISAVGQALLRGRQERQQHDIQQATLPVQLAQQQMAYQSSLQNLYKTQAEIHRDNAMADYYGTHGDYLTGRLGQLGDQYGSTTKIDDNGEPWLPGKNGQGLVYAGGRQLPPGYSPTFNKANQHGSVGGGLWGNIAAAADDPNASPAENAKKRLGLYGNVQSNIAGGKAGAVNDVNDRTKTRPENFEKTEIQSQLDSLGKRPNKAEQEQFQKDELLKQLLDPNGSGSLKPIDSLENRQRAYDQKLQDLKSRASNYIKSGDAKRGKKFDPNLYGSAPNSAPQTQAPQPNLGTSLDRIFGPAK